MCLCGAHLTKNRRHVKSRVFAQIGLFVFNGLQRFVSRAKQWDSIADLFREYSAVAVNSDRALATPRHQPILQILVQRLGHIGAGQIDPALTPDKANRQPAGDLFRDMFIWLGVRHR